MCRLLPFVSACLFVVPVVAAGNDIREGEATSSNSDAFQPLSENFFHREIVFALGEGGKRTRASLAALSLLAVTVAMTYMLLVCFREQRLTKTSRDNRNLTRMLAEGGDNICSVRSP